MKNILAFIVVIASAFVQPALAARTNIFDGKTARQKATAHFQATYQGTDGFWDVNGTTTEVLFFWHNQLMDSYYDKDGELIGTFHHVELNELPANALKQIQSDYKDYELKSTSVMEKEGQAPLYYVTVENATRMFLLQVSKGGDVIVFKILR